MQGQRGHQLSKAHRCASDDRWCPSFFKKLSLVFANGIKIKSTISLEKQKECHEEFIYGKHSTLLQATFGSDGRTGIKFGANYRNMSPKLRDRWDWPYNTFLRKLTNRFFVIKWWRSVLIDSFTRVSFVLNDSKYGDSTILMRTND
jgi:hypothetical protein